MRLHGSLAYDKLSGDLGVREAAGDQPEPLTFARGDLVQLCSELAPHRRFARERLGHGSRDRRIEQRLAAGDDMDRAEELIPSSASPTTSNYSARPKTEAPQPLQAVSDWLASDWPFGSIEYAPRA
jgi:hypothetical protein